MKRIFSSAFSLLGCALLTVCTLSFVVQAGVPPGTQGQTRTGESSLPGDLGPRLEFIGQLPDGIAVSKLVVAEIIKELNPGEPLPQRFSSGIGKLELEIEVTDSSGTFQTLEYSIENNSGPVEVEGYQTVMRVGEILMVSKDLGSKSGVFPDGPYRLTLHINDRDVAQLNWTVGGGSPVKQDRAPAVGAQAVAQTRAHSGRVGKIAITPDGKMLVSAAWDGTLKLWSVADRKYIKTLKGHSENVYALDISPDGKTLITGSYNDTLNLWSLPGGELQEQLERVDASTNSMAISIDGHLLATGYGTGDVRLWALPQGQSLKKLGANASVHSLVITPDGKTLIGGSNGPIELWSLPEGKKVGSLPTETWVNALVVTPDGSILASASESEMFIRLWSLPGGEEIAKLEGHKEGIPALAITPEGSHLISGSADNTIGIWSLSERKLIHVLEGHKADIFSLAITPDGKILASGDESGVINLWDLATNRLLGSL